MKNSVDLTFNRDFSSDHLSHINILKGNNAPLIPWKRLKKHVGEHRALWKKYANSFKSYNDCYNTIANYSTTITTTNNMISVTSDNDLFAFDEELQYYSSLSLTTTGDTGALVHTSKCPWKGQTCLKIFLSKEAKKCPWEDLYTRSLHKRIPWKDSILETLTRTV